MRKLKLQVQMSLDGFIADTNSQMDWMVWDWTKRFQQHVLDIHTDIDTILLGRKMSADFLPYWEKVVTKPDDKEYELGRKMVDTPKIIFSKTITHTNGLNATVNNGDLAEEVNKLKKQPGKNIIAYGGATFDASLISAGLIDEFHIFVNPTAIGKGMPIFNRLESKLDLKLVKSTSFDSGITELHYLKK